MKKHKALEQIGSMTGVVKLSDIIKIIMQIDNFKVDTLKNLKKAIEYSGNGLISLDEIYVDLTYQRRLRIQALINRLINSDFVGFDKSLEWE